MTTSILSKIQKRSKTILDEYYVAVRYLFLLVCGFAASLIFGALVGYSYSEKTTSFSLSCLVSPFSSSSDVYDAFGKLIDYSFLDTVFLLIIFISGITCLCRSILCVVNIARGFTIGLMICTFSSLMQTTATVSLLSMISVVAELVIASVIIIFYSSFAETASIHFMSSAQSDNSILLSKRFFSYFLLFMICFGAILLLRIFLSMILYVSILI